MTSLSCLFLSKIFSARRIQSKHQPGMSEADLREEGGGHALLIFYNHLFFCNQFEELQIVLFEVKLIINSLIYV